MPAIPTTIAGHCVQLNMTCIGKEPSFLFKGKDAESLADVMSTRLNVPVRDIGNGCFVVEDKHLQNRARNCQQVREILRQFLTAGLEQNEALSR